MKLIIHADDFGMTPSVNQAIIELCENGVLTSTSVMVNMPYYKEVVKLKELPVSLGLHSTFTEGFPIASKDKISSLLDSEGKFLSYSNLLKRLKSKKVLWEHVFIELEAQYLKLREVLENDLSFVDSHHGLQTKHKVFQKAFLKLGEKYKIHAIRTKNPVFLISEGGSKKLHVFKISSFFKLGLKRWVSSIYYNNLMKAYDKIYKTADGMILGGGAGVVNILSALTQMHKQDLPKGNYFIVVHPSIDEKGLENSNLKKVRVDEYKFLMSEQFKNFYTTKVVPINFKDI